MEIWKTMQLLVVSLALCVLTGSMALAGDTLAGDEYRQPSCDQEAGRYVARLWVELERLPDPGFSWPAYFQEIGADPVPEVLLSAEEEAEFAKVWAEFGVVCRGVTAAWTRALEDDPLLQTAIDCVARREELSWQCNAHSRGIERQYGKTKAREIEDQVDALSQANGMPWLDLDDTKQVQLYLWRCFLFAGKDVIQDEIVRRPTYQWMITTAPYASEISDKDEQITEERAIEIFQAAIRRQRELGSAEHEKNAARLDLPPNVLSYLELQEEAETIDEVGGTYLDASLLRYPDIHQTQEKLQAMLEQVAAIRPDAMAALYVVHSDMMIEHFKEIFRRQEEMGRRWDKINEQYKTPKQSLRAQAPALK